MNKFETWAIAHPDEAKALVKLYEHDQQNEISLITNVIDKSVMETIKTSTITPQFEQALKEESKKALPLEDFKSFVHYVSESNSVMERTLINAYEKQQDHMKAFLDKVATEIPRITTITEIKADPKDPKTVEASFHSPLGNFIQHQPGNEPNIVKEVIDKLDTIHFLHRYQDSTEFKNIITNLDPAVKYTTKPIPFEAHDDKNKQALEFGNRILKNLNLLHSGNLTSESAKAELYESIKQFDRSTGKSWAIKFSDGSTIDFKVLMPTVHKFYSDYRETFKEEFIPKPVVPEAATAASPFVEKAPKATPSPIDEETKKKSAQEQSRKERERREAKRQAKEEKKALRATQHRSDKGKSTPAAAVTTDKSSYDEFGNPINFDSKPMTYGEYILLRPDSKVPDYFTYVRSFLEIKKQIAIKNYRDLKSKMKVKNIKDYMAKVKEDYVRYIKEAFETIPIDQVKIAFDQNPIIQEACKTCHDIEAMNTFIKRKQEEKAPYAEEAFCLWIIRSNYTGDY